MNMIMGKKWKSDSIPSVFEKYNGLYIRYLEKCHIMASIKIDTTIIIASHSGIPSYKDAEDKLKFKIPSIIGIDSDKDITDEKEIIIENIALLNIGLSTFLLLLNAHYNDVFPENESCKFFSDDIYEYRRYIEMSANCMDECNTLLYLDSDKLKSSMSPVVGIDTLSTKGPLKYKESPILLKDKCYKTIHNIFGHQPAGLLPSYKSVKSNENTTYHVSLDISKAENPDGISNIQSYAYLTLSPSAEGINFGDFGVFTGKVVVRNRCIHYLTQQDSGIYKVLHKVDKLEDTDTNTNAINTHEIYISEYKNSINYNRFFNGALPYYTRLGIYETVNKDGVTVNYDIILHSIDNRYFYGVCSQNFHLLIYILGEDELKMERERDMNREKKAGKGLKQQYDLNTGGDSTGDASRGKSIGSISTGGKRIVEGISNNYKKSEKRFINGKKKTVIYIGKRGGEYVKIKGIFISLVKYEKIINKNIKK